MAQALSHMSLTAQVHDQSQVRPRGIYGGQSDTGTDFSLSIQFLPANITPPMLNSFRPITDIKSHTHKSKGNRRDCRVQTDQNIKRLLLTATHRIRIHKFTTNDQPHAWSSRCLQFITELFYSLYFSLC
jgi:hypothetical protein